MLDETIDENQPLSSEAEIYDLIISDLKEAEKLPAQYTVAPWALNGRNVAVSKGAVQATLGYVYMTMAGWPLNKGTEYYTMAAQKLKEVIDGAESGTYYYRLFDEYWKIHSKAYNLDNQESLLSIYYSRNYGTGDGSQACRAGISDIPEETGGYSNARAEIKFWYDFPMGPRKKATFGDVYYHNEHKLVVPWFYEAVKNCRNPYFIKAAFTNTEDEYDQTKSYSSQSNGWDDQSRPLIRLSEVYCWYAEAIGRSGQSDSKAIELLNRVRNRADGKESNLYSAGMTPEALAEAAYNEHGWEIAGWYWGSIGARYYNMRRMNRIKDHFEYRVSNPEIDVIPQYKLENPDLSILDVELPDQLLMKEPATVSGSWSDDKMYVPYPASDVLLNPNLKR